MNIINDTIKLTIDVIKAVTLGVRRDKDAPEPLAAELVLS